MTLDANEPTDQRPVRELPYYIRQNRVDINANTGAGASISESDVNVAAGATSLVISTNLSIVKIETVRITGIGAAPIAAITGGTDGQIKIFIFGDTNVTFTDGPKLPDLGSLYLNQLPLLSTFSPVIDDVLVLANVGGDGAATQGYWKELWRQLSVK